MTIKTLDLFSLKGKTAILTGSAGLLGRLIHDTLTELGARVIGVDLSGDDPLDITDRRAVLRFASVDCDILINAAVGNQKPVDSLADGWDKDIEIGLTGAVNMIHACSMSLIRRRGVILNIGSDLSLIAPDQTLYPPWQVKPLSYSVVKHGIVGLTRYIATTWPEVRCNCLCPGGIDVGQKIPAVPMGRLAKLDEMRGPVAFLVSNASSYMTGAVLVVDGGRTCA